MAITVVSGTDVSVTSAGANGPDTTGAVDTTGATMIELTVSSAVSATVAPTVSDNKGNTYTAHQRAAGVGAVCQKWHVYDPVVGSGHTFTVNHTGGYAVLHARAYAGGGIQLDPAAIPRSTNETTHPSAADLTSGYVIPSVDGALITSALTHSNIAISGLAIDGSTGGGTLTIITHHNLSASQNVGSAVADFVQTNATQVHPHWSWTPNGTQVALTMACYIEGDPIEPATDRNLLTGRAHTVLHGADNLVVGEQGTVDEANLVALFSLDGDPHTEDRDETFCVHATNICLNGELTINGDIFTGGGSPGSVALDDLSDVVITAPAVDDVLIYDGAQWVNSPVPAGSPGSPGGAANFWLFPFTEPIDGDFAWVNQGGATVTTFSGGLYLEAPTNASIGWRIRKKTAPSPPYVITAAIIPQMLAVSFHRIAMVWRNAGSGNFITIELSFKAATQPPDLIANRWNSATSHNGTTQVGPSLLGQPQLWFIRIADDNANRTASISFNGIHFIQFFTQARTTFITPDEVGFAVDPNNATYKVGLSLVHWEET